MHERDVAGSVTGYTIEAQALITSIKDLPQVAAYISEAESRLGFRASDDISEKNPYWLPFFSKLISDVSVFRKSEEGDATNKLLGEYFRSEAYAFPFLIASEYFIEEINHNYRQEFSTEHLPQIYADLTKWVVSRFIETARFVLHLDYSRREFNYSGWCNLFQQSEAVKNPWYDICVEFPVLIRWLANINRNIKSSLKEVFQRLEKDRKELESNFSIPQSAKLSAISPGLSDPHHCGRTVMRLSFSNGSTIIYKPKSLTIESEFNKFASLYEEELGIATLNVLSQTNYGWVEDIGDRAQIGYLLENATSIGRAAACFWLLNATDMHFENVRPTSKGVYALDIETLLTAPFSGDEPEYDPSWRNHSINTTLLFNSVVAASGRLFNISGFNPSPNLSLPNGQVRFDIVGDTVNIVISKPKYGQSAGHIHMMSHESTVVSNVVEAFRLASTNGLRKLIENFILTLDEGCKLRFVFRDTYFYGRMLDRMRQPRFMRDGALLSLDLIRLHGGVPKDSVLADRLHAIVEDEIYQLLQGDVPYFSYDVNSLAIHTSSGVIDRFFKESAKSHALAKVRELEESDVSEQSALLAIALGDFPKIPDNSPTEYNFSDAQAEDIGSFLLQLKNLAESIVASAFCPSQTPARWFSLFGDVSGEELRVDVGDRGFFGGTWGIILALQAAETALSSRYNTNGLRKFLDDQAVLWSILLEQVRSQQQTHSALLGFSGLGGEVFAQATLLSLNPIRWSFLNNHISWSLNGIEDSIANDNWLDVIGGSAGLILGCEQLLKLGVASEATIVAAELQQLSATRLMKTAIDMGDRLAWKIPKEKEPLLGFAHGWAGIVAALASAGRRAMSQKQNTAIKDCLREAAAYPQTLFYAQHVWIDNRIVSSENTPLNRSWCNGVPGFLRGMLEIQDHLTEEVSLEVNSMVKHIRTLSSSNAYRFCCGEMGNIDFLLDYNRATLSPKSISETQSRLIRITEEILSFANSEGKQNRQMPELSFPGLFQGQSGLIYCAARFVLPNLPSLSGHGIQLT